MRLLRLPLVSYIPSPFKAILSISFPLKGDNYHYSFLSLRRERLGEGELLY